MITASLKITMAPVQCGYHCIFHIIHPSPLFNSNNVYCSEKLHVYLRYRSINEKSSKFVIQLCLTFCLLYKIQRGGGIAFLDAPMSSSNRLGILKKWEPYTCIFFQLISRLWKYPFVFDIIFHMVESLIPDQYTIFKILVLYNLSH